MTHPLLLPPRLLVRALDDLRSLARAADRLPELERELFRRLDQLERLESVERGLAGLPEAIEHALKEHLERQVEGIQRLHPELVQNRENSGQVPPLIDGMRDQLDALHAEMSAIREALAPLQSVAERADRLADRLPGT